MEKNKKICFVYDVKGWTFYNKANYLKKYLNNFYEIDVVKYNKVDNKKYDLIICFSPGAIPPKVDYTKTICGVSSHKSINFKRINPFKYVFSNDKLIFNKLKKTNKWYLPNGVEINLFKGNVRRLVNKTITIGAVGSLSRKEHKGYTRLNKILLGLKNKGFDVKSNFLFVDANNNKKIKTHQEMVDYYKNVDIFLVSSISETTPNPLLEAMSMGIPCISNDTGMANILIENGKSGFLIEDCNDLSSYEKNIIELIRNPDLYNEISINSLKKIQYFDWSKMALNFKVMIDEVLEKK